jgi:hypothetical protein
MYSRLTPQGRAVRFGFLKLLGWTTGAVAVAGGFVMADKAIIPSFSGWSRQAAIATGMIKVPPPVMATTVQQPAPVTYSPPVYQPTVYQPPPPRTDIFPLSPETEYIVHQESRKVIVVPEYHEPRQHEPWEHEPWEHEPRQYEPPRHNGGRERSGQPPMHASAPSSRGRR